MYILISKCSLCIKFKSPKFYSVQGMETLFGFIPNLTYFINQRTNFFAFMGSQQF